MKPQLTTILPEVIDCIAEARHPTEEELRRVADHIWTDVHGSRSAFAWGRPSQVTADRQLTLKAAQAALTGDDRANPDT